MGASDIHIETFEKSLVIRFRVDGTLHEMLRPGRKLASLLVSRIKVMARLDIAEKRIPQDGRIALLLGGRAIDVRVSTMPSAWGERAVLRLLDKSQACLSLEYLGLNHTLTAQLRQLLHCPHGIFLVTGPTGSGKSTTLYAGLQELNNHTRNILTVEDPVEYMIEGIGQTQVNNRVGMTFARGLRAILRQDPDVVMVGEIRDTETAEIAVQASLTGHLNTLDISQGILLEALFDPWLTSVQASVLLQQRPAEGWKDVDQFLSNPILTRVDEYTKRKVKDVLVVQSNYFWLRSDITVNETELTMNSLIARQGPQYFSVQRHHTGDSE